MYSFPVKNLLELETARLRPKDLTTAQLRARLAELEAGEPDRRTQRAAREHRVQIHRRYALPLAPTLFALIAVPLAMRLTRGGRSWGVLLCSGLVGIYYGVLTFSQYLALEGAIPAAIALWIPNALCALAAAVLLARARGRGDLRLRRRAGAPHPVAAARCVARCAASLPAGSHGCGILRRRERHFKGMAKTTDGAPQRRIG